MSLTFEDKFEIQELIARYASDFDSGNFDEWLELWAEDGVWEGALGVYSGKSELKKLTIDLGGASQDKRRVMTNIVIDGSAEQAARAECYMLVMERKVSTAILATAVFVGTFKKVTESWKLAHCTVTMDPSCVAMRSSNAK